MKLKYKRKERLVCSHSPRGGCGLKYPASEPVCDVKESLSARRVWIEILIYSSKNRCNWSLSARRVWIEITYFNISLGCISVTLREEGVD